MVLYIACFKYEEKNYEIPVNKPQVTRDYQISKEDRNFRTVIAKIERETKPKA